jgi:hypothetical protein
VVEDFPETILISEPMKTGCSSKEEKQSREERLETKQPNWKFDFQRAKEYQKIEKKSSLEVQNCNRAIIHGRKSTG